MRITTKIIYDIDGNVQEHDYYDYSGPVELCDRAAQNSSKQQAAQAGQLAGQEGSSAAGEHSLLTPFYRQEMNAKHAFDPSQTNELLNFAASPIAGSAATTAGQAASEAARTRNTSGFSSSLDQAARDRQKGLSEANLGIGAADISGAKELNQEGAKGMMGLYGADTDSMLKSMGLQNQDTQTQIDAGKSGWFQNMTNAINAGSNLIGALKRK